MASQQGIMKRLLWIAIPLLAFVVAVVLVPTLTGRRGAGFVVGPPLPPGQVRPQVSATWDRAYLLAPDGSLWAWGGTQFGSADIQLPGSSEVPRQVGTNTDWRKFSASWLHVIAIKNDGSLWGWGNNGDGQLGVARFASTNQPIRIGPDYDWQEVSVGAGHTLALKTNGSLWAWGQNREGQVGDPARTNWFEPREILPGTRWRAISAGYFNSYALRVDGTLWRWGLDPVTGGANHDLAPRQLGDATNWAAISAGEYHLGDLALDGGIWIHGQNAHVVAPRDATGSVAGLVQVGRDQDWREIYSGVNHMTLRKADGSWWGGGNRTLGNARSASPQRIEWTMEPWAFSASGGTCILLAKDGTLWTWGERLGSTKPRQIVTETVLRLQRLLSGRGFTVGNPQPVVDAKPHKVWSLPLHIARPDGDSPP
jgi:hypothetical protein